MGRYIIRRSLFAIPTLLAIGLIIFTILDFAPGDPASQLPLTIPNEVKERLREALGINDPFFIKWLKWNRLMFINEPLHAIDSIFGTCIGDCDNRDRIISWSSRAPAMDIIYERLPQTLWVLGLAFVLGTLLAIPVGVYLPAVLGGRQRRYVRDHDRVLAPDVLHRFDGDRHLQRVARLVPLVLQPDP